MYIYWRHALVVVIGVILLVALQWVGVMVLPADVDPVTKLQPTPMATPPALATPTPSLTPTVTPTTPVPTPNINWPQPVANPLSYTMVVNKKFRLAADFVPPDLRTVNVPHTNNHSLRAVVASAVEQMVAAAARQQVHLRLLSGYRAYDAQKRLYASYAATYGQAAADRFSARPGHSEHQSGLALDIGDANAPSCDIQACFGNTAGGKWISRHGVEYGFIVRYAANKESVTGYMSEPWHIRYVGADLARTLAATGQALEEYAGVAGGGYN